MSQTEPEAMRTLVLADVDKVLDAPWIVRKMLSPQSVRLLKAVREWAAAAPPETLSALAASYDRQPAAAAAPGEPDDVQVCAAKAKLLELCEARRAAADNAEVADAWNAAGQIVDTLSLRSGHGGGDEYVLTVTLGRSAGGLTSVLVMALPADGLTP